MHPALWISKTGLDAQSTDLQVTSNNLANASTVGYKKNRAVFEDLFYQTVRAPGSQSSQNTNLPSGLMLGTGVKTVATQKDFTQGSFQLTQNQMDMAIEGAGFFQVLMPDGSTTYTRAGNFALNEDGQVVTSGSGFLLQPNITVPDDATSFDVSIDGIVTARVPNNPAPVNLGQIQLADFINPAGLEPIGQNLFRESQASGAPIIGNPSEDGLGNLRGGQLESSNVSVVEELIGLIETQRAYEINAKVISGVDQMLQYVNQTL
ncbi:flagellar basal-body rod protein FlgG [Pleionea mediterranea]|jgi:flagellar basal-body rod protein FlgG|uniref:Flagellar basal-body rod protein FlgG n=1 Tax=Pleionea mediterranea TaxID=523701 RepID=A0A316FLY8_9GAMM|nr:flagellar basal-body rod protein FlgG [Pleionea mediterranea]PWK49185.1 flagellar basal-body rod protein FlgG [Pleionea mediterranea]